MPLKRIAILSAGSRGDVYPYAALGRAIQSRGCTVRLVTFTPFGELVTGQGLEFFPVSDPMVAVKSSDDWHRWQSSDTDLPRKLWALRRLLKQCQQPFTQMLDECLDACRDCDAILSATSGFAGPHIAEKFALPFSWAFLQPETPTSHFPHYLSPWSRSLGEFVNYATYAVASGCFQVLFGNTVARWREKSLGLRPSRASVVPGSKSSPVLYGFSRHVVAKPADWDERKHVTGYWILNSEASWSPSREFSSFLDEGPPPIAVCLNAIQGRPDILDVIACATRQTGQRAAILTGGKAVQPGRNFNHVITVDYAPHEWLFPRVTAVIHHGGAGTTAAALRAGQPSILVPSFFDQSFWANAVYRLGASPAPLSPHRLSVENLAIAIHEVITRPQYRQRTSSLGERISEEDGAGSAAEIFLRSLS